MFKNENDRLHKVFLFAQFIGIIGVLLGGIVLQEEKLNLVIYIITVSIFIMITSIGTHYFLHNTKIDKRVKKNKKLYGFLKIKTD